MESVILAHFLVVTIDNLLIGRFVAAARLVDESLLIGTEGGAFEAWAWPLKILRGFDFSFLLGTSTTPVRGQDIVRSISVDPAVTTLTFTYQSFTVKAHYVAAIDDPGAVILLEVDAAEPDRDNRIQSHDRWYADSHRCQHSNQLTPHHRRRRQQERLPSLVRLRQNRIPMVERVE